MKALITFFISLGFLFSQASFAQENSTLKAKVETPTGESGASGFTDTVCTNGPNTRKVELISGSADAKGCEVHYKKETEQAGHDQVLWSANNDLSYCHAKAAAFVDKLTGMGWACTAK